MGGHSAQILVADDDEDVLNVLADLVTDLGFRPILARSGSEAFERFVTERPDVVLTDLSMPGLDGLALGRRLRQVDPDAVVLIVTGHADVPTAIEAVRQGAFDYVPKPFDIGALAARLGEAVDRRRAVRASAEEQRLAAVGEVSAALNHAILNPLTGILGVLHVLETDGLDAASKAEVIDEARHDAARIASTVKRLRSLAGAPVTDYVRSTKMLDLGSPPV